MANKKISQLTTLNPVPSGAFLAVVDGGVTYKAAASRVSHYTGSKAATIDGGGDTTLDWNDSNIYYAVVTASIETTFINVSEGQTLRYYVKNSNGLGAVNSAFVASAGTTLYWAVSVPTVAANKTNFYTFTRINAAIFADVVTGYVI
tara:strand:+ start:413 stop:853 length:441 start_codon:yes stop_codon:yes gene_type:complete